jgi:hypothetical protein
MFVSLDPTEGHIDVYSPQVQQLLATQKADRVFLGDLCFQATVHFDPNGKHFQTTPGTEATVRGHRQVREVADSTTRQCLYKKHCHGIWMFCDATADGAQEAVVPPMPQKMVPVWQWCDQSVPSRKQCHWFCFAPEIERLLVEAWGQSDVPQTVDQTNHPEEFDIQIISGVKKTIHINRSQMFHRMTELGKTKWVRRTFMEANEAEHYRIAFTSPPAPKNDCCPICLEDFTDGNNTVTLHCQHAFHLQCLQSLRNSECPLCRSPF